MYKELIICLVIILSIIVVNFFMQNYTKNTVELMDDKLEKLQEALLKEDNEKEKIQEYMNDVMKNWKKQYEKLAFFIEHDELEKVETELTSLEANIKIEEYEQAIPELEKSIFILNHIKEKFRLNLKNVF